MIDRKRVALFTLLAASGVGIAASGSAVRAEAPAPKFLEALRERGYFDTALDYLASAEQSPVVPPFFKAQIPYERGHTLVQLAVLESDRDEQIKLLKQAEGHLNEFLTKNSASPLVPSARKALADILVAQARLTKRDSKGTDKAKLAEADKLYTQAYNAFQSIREDLKKRLEAIPKNLNPADRAQALIIETRDQYRRTYQQVRLLSAVIIEEQAELVKDNKAEYEKRINTAIAENADIHADYRNLLAGIQAKVFQANGYLKLGKYAEAIGAAKEVLDLPDDPLVRSMKIQALAIAAQCWNHESIKQYDETVTNVGAMLDTARPAEEREPEFLRMKLALASALKARNEANPRGSDATRDLRRAKMLAFQVSNVVGDLQKEGRELLIQLGGPEAAEEQPEPKSFAEARQAGKDALDVWQSSEAARKAIADTPENAQKLSDLNQTIAKSREDAIRYFRDALRLAGPEELPEDLGQIRYYLAYLYYSSGDLLSAGVMGEFVAKRTSEDPNAGNSGKLAIASYKKLYDEAQESMKDFYLARTESVADYLGTAFKGREEGTLAVSVLVPMQLEAGKIDEAKQLVATIPADSPQRAQMELRVGQVAWAEYLKGKQKIRELEGVEGSQAEIAALQPKLEAFQATAQETLEGGVQRMDTSVYDNQDALACIFLAQLYVGSNRAKDAVALLEDPQKGPLPKLAAGNSDIDPKIAAEAYKVALRAYVSSIAAGANANEAVDKAKQTMQGLAATIADKSTLTNIYIAVAQDLQKQLETAGQAERESLSKAFAAFLEEVGAGSQDLNVLVWVAETFYGIAQSMVGPNGQSTPTSEGYFKQAQAAYAQILSMGANKAGDWLPDDVRTKVEMKLAMVDRELGDYKSAVDRFEKVLSKKDAVLSIQAEAAETLMKWGEKDPEQYFAAVMGARKNDKGRNVIWGWNRLSTVAHQNKFEEVFFNARLRMAEALRAYGLAAKDAAKKKKHLDLAETSILAVQKGFPTMGGPEWRKKYDDVLRLVQKDLNKPVTGLPETKTPSAAPATSATPATETAAR